LIKYTILYFTFIEISSNRSFGLVFFIISLFPLFKVGNIRIWAIIAAIIFFILGLLNKQSRKWVRVGGVLLRN